MWWFTWYTQQTFLQNWQILNSIMLDINLKIFWYNKKKVDLIIHTLYCENIIQNIRKYTERWSTYPSDFSDWIRAVKNNLVTWIIPIHLGSKKKVSANHLPREMVLSNVIDYRRVINDTTIKQLCVVTPNREMLPRFKEDIWSRETEFANFYIKEIWITNNQEIHPLINLMLGAY